MPDIQIISNPIVCRELNQIGFQNEEPNRFQNQNTPKAPVPSPKTPLSFPPKGETGAEIAAPNIHMIKTKCNQTQTQWNVIDKGKM